VIVKWVKPFCVVLGPGEPCRCCFCFGGVGEPVDCAAHGRQVGAEFLGLAPSSELTDEFFGAVFFDEPEACMFQRFFAAALTAAFLFMARLLSLGVFGSDFHLVKHIGESLFEQVFLAVGPSVGATFAAVFADLQGEAAASRGGVFFTAPVGS
jgi:hypothetical protein